MPTDKIVSLLLLVLGLGLLAASLLADVIGIGDDPGFGPQQTKGAIAGGLVAGVGLLLTLKKKG